MTAGTDSKHAMSLAEALQSACPGIGLRSEDESDLGFVRDLYASVRAQELAPVPWSEAQKRSFTDAQLDLQRSHYREHYPGAEFLVIEQDGAPIGRMYLCRFAREIRLMDISLSEANRNAGVGTRLLRALLDIARRERRNVTLHVEPDNPAQRLYRRLGFEKIESRGVYDFLGWSAEAKPSA